MTKYCKTIKTKSIGNKKERSFFSRLFRNFQLNKKLLTIIIAVFAAMFLVFYLMQINSLATKGFELRELEDQISQLEDENKKIELQLVEMQSMRYLAQHALDLDLVDAEAITYLDTAGASFAQR